MRCDALSAEFYLPGSSPGGIAHAGVSVEIVFDIPVAQIINARADPHIEPLVKHLEGSLLGPDRAVAHPTVKLYLGGAASSP